MADSINAGKLKNPMVLLATGFGAGCAPKAPGTAGTLVAIPFVYFMQQLSLEFYLVITVVTCVVGIVICDIAANKLGVHDHPGIVFDEIAGYFVTMIAAPTGWVWIVTGFVLFRVFDIIKPWPISILDKNVKGGVGIMVDDIVAGCFALVILQLCAYYWA